MSTACTWLEHGLVGYSLIPISFAEDWRRSSNLNCITLQQQYGAQWQAMILLGNLSWRNHGCGSYWMCDVIIWYFHLDLYRLWTCIGWSTINGQSARISMHSFYGLECVYWDFAYWNEK